VSDDLQSLRQELLESDQPIGQFEELLSTEAADDRIFGMTAVERMFVSIGCFLVTSLAGFVLLLLLGKIVL